MLERSAYSLLLDWKKNSQGKALLVEGARQVGKTFLIERFAQREYPNFVKVDFLKDDAAARALLEARSSQEALSALSLATGKKLIPRKTLVFLDEVQEAPNVVTFSKYLVQDGRFDLVMSGSLLGIELTHVKSLPVGYLRIMKMCPLTFEEFCRSQGVPEPIMRGLEGSFRDKAPVNEGVHERMSRLFRLYLVIGGMPAAVQAHLDERGDLGAVRQVQRELVRLYGDDIAKHAGNRALQVKAIFDALPSQLDKENKRFLLNSLKSKARFERFANDFAWIVGADAALKTTNVTDPRPMLERSEEAQRFKLYQSDVGMLMSRYHPNVALDVLAANRSVNCGGVYENVVAQELQAAGIPLHYYHHSKKGEVDFIAERGDGSVLPIEVKSGKGYKRHVALNNLLRAGEYGIDEAYVLSEANVSVEQRDGGRVSYLPLYMLPFIADELKDKGLKGVLVRSPSW